MLQGEEPSASGDMETVQPSAATGTGQAVDDQQPDTGPSTAVAGGAVNVDADDDAAVCSTLFRGLVFFLGCANEIVLGNDRKTIQYTEQYVSGCRNPCCFRVLIWGEEPRARRAHKPVMTRAVSDDRDRLALQA